MNAGRDVERLIAGWLVEEAAPGAPDRVLDATRQVVRRTNQRRFAALWRESMFTPARVAALAALFVLAVGSGFLIGRVTSPTGPAAPAATDAPGSTAPAVTIESYRAARNAICAKYNASFDAMKTNLDRIYDPTLPAADRSIKVQALTDIASSGDLLINEIESLEPPASMAAAHITQVANYRQVSSLIHQELPLLALGKYPEAEALDLATNPLSRAIEAFESKYGLAACP